MIRSIMGNFINEGCTQETENIIYKILKRDFHNIDIQKQDEIMKTIYNGIDEYLTGNDNIEWEENVEIQVVDNIPEWMWYISKVNVNGLKMYPYKTTNSSPIIDFENNKCAVIFGWNGDGKTSLMEAIEFCLTGDVEESKRRNHAKPKDYLLNKQSTKGYVEVELYCPKNGKGYITLKRTEKGKLTVEENKPTQETAAFKEYLVANEEYMTEVYKKYFIERNRLENFILSKGKELNVRYGELLGVDEFYNFYKENFTTSLKVKEVPQFKTTDTANEQLKIVLSEKELLLKPTKEPVIEWGEEEEEEIKELLRENGLISDDKLNISAIKYEEIKDLLQKKIQVATEQENHKIQLENLKTCLERYIDLFMQHDQIQKKYVKETCNIDYLDFYTKAQAIVVEMKEYCPLCGEKADKNDILDRLENNISTLKEVAELKAKVEEQKTLLDQSCASLLNFKNDYPEIATVDLTNERELIGVSARLSEKISELQTSNRLSIWSNIVARVQLYDIEYKSYLEKKEETQKQLKDIEEKVVQCQLAATQESILNAKKEKVLSDYKKIEKNLDEYYQNLITEKLNVLCMKILEYYNRLETEEQIDLLEASLDKKMFKFEMRRGAVVVDPLQVLSEGQLRCFGFAILMAVADEINPTFLLFDDIVNAIDIEHRANIIQLLVEEKERSKNKQLIITTHDKLFREKLAFKLCGGNPNKINTFYIQNDGYFKANTQDVILKEKVLEAIKQKDSRSALMNMRIWTENNIYSLAEGKVSLVFHDEMRKYSLNSVFDAVVDKYTEDFPKVKIQAIHDYFMLNGKYNWGILNQENHFWSEQNTNIDSKTLREIYEAVYCIDIMRELYQLGMVTISQLIKYKDKNRLSEELFDRYRVLVDSEFIKEDKWGDKFKIVKKYLLA